MNDKRILAYKTSEKLTEADLNSIPSGGASTNNMTHLITGPGVEVTLDITTD